MALRRREFEDGETADTVHDVLEVLIMSQLMMARTGYRFLLF